MSNQDIIESADIMDPVQHLMLADHLDDIGRCEEAQLVRDSSVIRREDGTFVLCEQGHYHRSDHERWSAAGLRENIEMDRADYVNQEDDYADSSRGEWFVLDDYNAVIYYGTFGNDNSPGASHYTYAEVYDTRVEYLETVAEWESMPEYLESDGDEKNEESEDDDEQDD